jgi:acyl-CoA synthetase (AMP-forming)/AMP-acid ligase II
LQLRIVRDQWGRSFGSLTASEFERLSLPAGEAGEIVVSGQHVLTGRLGGAQNEANQFLVSGVVWHRTGDAGYCDPRGRLWLLGRCQARLEDGRGELYPLGVEQAALQQANVRRAALLSVRGRRVLAVEPSCEAARLDVDLLRKSLAFAQLDAVQILKRIPVDARHNAKIDYETLRIRLEKMA